MPDDEWDGACLNCLTERRSLLKGALGLGLGLAMADAALAQDKDPKKLRPQPGDALVYADGDRKGQPVVPTELAVGGAQIMAWAMEPAGKTVRDGSRLNKVALLRLDPEQAPAAAADGVIAFSAVCTHAGCDVSGWKQATRVLFCPCHYSEFDPRNGAKVVAGPAPRSLPSLPVKSENGALVVAGPFKGRVGFQKG